MTTFQITSDTPCHKADHDQNDHAANNNNDQRSHIHATPFLLAMTELRVRARITSQSWCSDLHQIGSRTIERNRRRNRAYAEDFAIEERPKMVSI